ncbi:MAG TPA: hypothetical protein VFO89_07185, partial [Thermoanaerobaculia bacterium]|nr:hypothetical protein [Thermoanaerobaculia bacterium]
MFRAITSFELRFHLKGFLFYILLFIFFLIPFGAATTDSVRIGGAISNVHRNAPYVIMQFMLVMSIFGVLATTAFVANSVHRDFELGTDALFFSRPIRKTHYLAGRFIGSFLVAVLVFLGVAGAVMLGSAMPWIDQAQLGPFQLWPYVYSMLVIVVPNLFLAGAIFFSVAALTRSLMATYSAAIVYLVGIFVSAALLDDAENQLVAGLLDPFGLGAFQVATRYWTVFQKNTQVVPLEGVYLLNRILWVSVGLAVLAFAFRRFDFTTATRKSRKKAAGNDDETAVADRISLALPQVSQIFGGAAAWRQFLATVKLEAVAIFKSIPFAVILIIGMLNLLAAATNLEDFVGTPVYPTTGLMVEAIQGGFSIFALLIVAFYAGDIVWRERNLKLSEVVDAMPLPTWAQWSAKLTSLAAVSAATLGAAVLTTVLIQWAKGYTNFEPLVYLQGVFLEIAPFLILVTALAFIMQVLFNQKFVGFLGVLVYFVLGFILPAVDLEHNLYRFASAPPASWSDMNGYGHFYLPLAAFNGYWMLFCAVFLVVGHLLWVRGTEEGFGKRLAIAAQRFTKPVAAALVITLAAFISTGCYIYYNTNVLNRYRTADEGEALQAAVEKKYKKFEGLAQPKVIAAKADVDIVPETRTVSIRGTYTLRNKTGAPIPELHVTFNPENLTRFEASVDGARLTGNDRKHGYLVYRFDTPLQPGQERTLRFESGFAARGFVNGASNTNVVHNGTFFNSLAYFPSLGYNSAIELQDRNDRRKYGLPELERMKKP